jgi:uncharacterized protein YecA (UPF0149 family)
MGETVKLKIELRDIGAKRVVIVPGDITLASLHDVIQALFGWEDCHLWMFSNNKGKNIWEPSLPDSSVSEYLDPEDFSVEDMLQKVGDHAEYEYDFGDSWRHRITRMTDPKPGVGYGCVKTEGPDGEEDSRFSLADEDESSEVRVPSLEDVNRRLPALETLVRLALQVILSEKANGGNGPRVADILNAKSAADLEIGAMGLPGTQGQSGDGLKRATADFLESDTGLKASVEGLIISITEPYFKAFAEAAKSGSALMSGIDMDEVEVFRQCCVTHVQRSGTRDVRLFVAKEVRDLWPEMCMRWCNLHRDWDTVHALCDAAVRLYGGITVHDLAAIVDRFDENGGKTSEELLESALGVRASCWDSMHFVEDGTIYGDKFESLDSYREFARKRDVYPRWETDDYGEFYEYSDRKYFENTQQREAIVEFLMKTFGDSRKTAEGVANEMQSDLRDGASAGTIADMFAVDFLSPDMSRRKVAEIASLVRDVRDNMRLAEYNGNTYSELSQKGTVASTAPKVGRNDPCPCGSGLKYKKCCGRNG